MSFAGLAFLSLYTAGKLHLFDTRGHTVCLQLKKKSDGLIFASVQSLAFCSPVVWSRTRCRLAYHGLPTLVPLVFITQVRRLTYVSISPDHWQDVTVGSILGLVMANFAYRQYFHSLSSNVSHLPYAPRTQRPEDADAHPAPGLPRYRTLHRPADEDDDGEVELIDGMVRRGEPEQLEQGWKAGPSLEGGFPPS